MKRPTWQFHLLLFAILSLLSTAVNASYIDGESIEKREASPAPTTFKHHDTKHHHNHTKIHTVTVNNCTASAIQSKMLHQTKKINGTKTLTAIPTLPAIVTMKDHTSTVFVCHKTKHVTGHHHSTKKHHSSKHHHTTTTHVSKKHHHSTKKHHSSKKHTSSKKEVHHHVSKKKKHTTKKHHSTTTTTTTHSKKHTTTSKKTHKTKKTTTTTKAHKKHTTTAVATTTTLEVVAASLPTTRVNSSGDDSSDDNNDPDNEPNQDITPEATTPEATTPEATTPEATTPAAAAAATTPASDSNNQVTAQSVNQEKSVDAEPQSKVVGVSVGAVVGCIAAAGLAGMFIYKRKQKNDQEQDIEYNDSNVNTRWKTQSFMAVVAGAVAKLPKRSNSQTSQRSVGVLGSIRRAVSNASSFRSNRSSQQSYGMATSDPLPPLARIDGDQARYYSEPTSPNEHTHAY